MLGKLDLFWKDIRITENLYWEQTVCIQIENKFSNYTEIERSARQGCVFSPNLFSLQSKAILRELEVLPGFIIGGLNLKNIRFADDRVDSRHRNETLDCAIRIV